MSYYFNYTGERAAVRRAVENDPQIPESIKAIVKETLHDRVPEHSKEINGVAVSGSGHVNSGDDSAIGNVQSLIINPLKLTLALLLLLAVLVLPAQAQSATNSPTYQSFPQTAMQYLTSVNTNLSWVGKTFVLGVGGDYENGQQWGNNIDAEYDLANTSGNCFALGARMRNAGIAGTVEMEELKAAYCIDYFDLRIEPGLYAGYDNEYGCAVIEPELDIRKLMTANTFLGIYISEPCLIGGDAPPQAQQWVPNVGAETGCTLGGLGPNGTPVAFRTRAAHAMTAFRHFVSPSSM